MHRESSHALQSFDIPTTLPTHTLKTNKYNLIVLIIGSVSAKITFSKEIYVSSFVQLAISTLASNVFILIFSSKLKSAFRPFLFFLLTMLSITFSMSYFIGF